MQTLAQAHERLNDLANQMRRLSKGFNAEDEEEAARAAELDEAIEAVSDVAEQWLEIINAPAEEAAPVSASAPASTSAPKTAAPAAPKPPADTSTKSGG